MNKNIPEEYKLQLLLFCQKAHITLPGRFDKKSFLELTQRLTKILRVRGNFPLILRLSLFSRTIAEVRVCTYYNNILGNVKKYQLFSKLELLRYIFKLRHGQLES